MKKEKSEQNSIVVKARNKLNGWHMTDFIIDIFGESISEYLKKLNAVAEGRYELDDYDMQVLTIAMEQSTGDGKLSPINK